MPQPELPHAERPRIVSVRQRVLTALVLSTLLALVTAGLVTFSLERGRLDAEIDTRLAHRHEIVVELSKRGTDPVTGERLTDVERLLRAAMQSSLPTPAEGEMGIIGGNVALIAPEGRAVRPEAAPVLVGAVRSAADRVRIDTSVSSAGSYRYIVVPVTVPGDPRAAALVAVTDLGVEHAAQDANYRTFALVGLLALAMSGLISWLFVGRTLEPIGWVRRTAQEINDKDLSRRIPVRGRDDLADLTRTINAMLDRLESTFAAQRSLYDDVGHELRTPLTVMRGHLEVMDASDPGDVQQTRAIALSEVDRMAGLVDDLITLARSERPDFVSPTPTDIGDLTDEVFHKATALGDRRWELEAIAEGTGALDGRRVSQALLELARNAVKFSAPGSTVGIGSELRDDRVRLWVRDEGRGIAAADLPAIRRRFGRVASDVDGSGLGLAIVGSIARAHGGDMLIESHPGKGSTFSLDLPRGAQHNDGSPD